MATLNHQIAGRTRKEYKKEYIEQNKDKLKEYKKEWQNANKDKIKDYYEANKDKISKHKNQKMICACGGKHTLGHKSQHEKTKMHQQFIQQCNV